jgi:hypothetical protein
MSSPSHPSDLERPTTKKKKQGKWQGKQHSLILELGLILPRGRFICTGNEDLFTGCTPGDEDGHTLCLWTNEDIDDAIVGGGYAAG